MQRLFLVLAALVLADCVTAPPAPKLEHFAGQWQTGIAESGFFTTDGRYLGIYGENNMPPAACHFQYQQPEFPRGSARQIAYYEVVGSLVAAPPGTPAPAMLQVAKVFQMEPAHQELPPFGASHPLAKLPASERAVFATHLLGSLPPVLDEDEGIAEALRRDAELEVSTQSGIRLE